MADKKEDIRTPDIYNYLTRRDLSDMSTVELRKLRNISNDAYDGILGGLKSIGELGFWACANEGYTPNLAKEDLERVSRLLMHLPRIAEALSFNAENAQFVICQRDGFPFTEVNNGEH